MSDPASSGTGSRPKGLWEPPSLEMMQALLPQYEFICLLGRGGMGAVYKARQVSLDRMVAIKVLPGDLLDDTDTNFMERFKQEARTMARMNHPAIVGVYDFGQTQGGLLYFVMEFIDGTDVAQMILSQRRLAPEHALAITAHVCDALAYAHGHGVVHRDIKPANVLINMEGQVKVADFGLAKANDGKDSGLTKSNVAMGTPDFVAPEALISGIPLDGRADLYAVGVMLYQMLTGEIPRGLWQMPSVKVGADNRFDAIIAKAMQTDREMRYQSSQEIRQDLDRILTMPVVQAGGQSSVAIPKQTVAAHAQKPVARSPQPRAKEATAPQPADPPPKKKPNFLLGGIIAFWVIVGIAFFAWYSNTREDEPKTTSPPPASPAPPRKAVASTAPSQAPALPRPQASPPKAKGAPSLPPGVEKQRFDLLALVDPVADRVTTPLWGVVGRGEWVRSGKNLVYVSDGKAGKIVAPVNIAATDYEVELSAETKSGTPRLHLDIPVKRYRILPLILHDPKLKVINQKAGGTWPRSEQRLHVVVRVRRGSGGDEDRIVITNKNNGALVEDWSGNLDSVAKGAERRQAFPDADVVSLFSANAGYTIDAWTLRVFEGEAKELRVPAAPALATAPAPTSPNPKPQTAPATAAMAVSAPPSATPPPPVVAEDPVAKRLAELEAQFQKAFDAQAGKAYQAAIAQLNTSFLGALDRALATASKAGNLDEALALRSEKERISSGQGLPPADLESLPASVKSLRATYRQTVAQRAAERDKAAVPLYDFYDQALARYQAELTQQQKLDEALRIKKVRDEVALRRPKLEADPAANTAAANSASKSAPKTEPADTGTGRTSRWYEAARWVTQIGGYIDATKNGDGIRIEKEDDIPAGRFEIKNVAIVPRGDIKVTDDDFARLSGLKELERLEVAGVSVTDAAFAFLPTTPALRVLVIRDVPITDGLLAHLAPLQNLAHLQLQSSPAFTGVGLDKLATAPKMGLLWISSCGLKDACASGIAKMTSLRHLQVDGNSELTDAFVAPLGALPRLAQVTFSRCPRITGSGFESWGAKPALRELHLTGTGLGEEGFAYVGRFTGLEHLSLDDCKVVGDENLTLIAPLTKLRSFNAMRCRITGTGFSALKGAKDMRSMLLHYETPISGEGLRVIAATFPNLERLAIGHGNTATPEDLRSFARLKSFKSIELAFPTANDEWLRALATIPPLEDIYANSAPITSEGIAALKPLKFLTSLHVERCEAVDDKAVATLKEMKSLRSLRLFGTGVTPAAVADLKKALPACDVSL